MNKAQGGVEYLLIIGGAVIISIIVVSLMLTIGGQQPEVEEAISIGEELTRLLTGASFCGDEICDVEFGECDSCNGSGEDCEDLTDPGEACDNPPAPPTGYCGDDYCDMDNGECDSCAGNNEDCDNIPGCSGDPYSASCSDGYCDLSAGECEVPICPECDGIPGCEYCGDGICNNGETELSCPGDCYCGNGTCDPGEDSTSCPSDCSAPPPPPPPNETDCSNGSDDDSDGLTDCEDAEDCCGDAACSSELVCGQPIGFLAVAGVKNNFEPEEVYISAVIRNNSASQVTITEILLEDGLPGGTVNLVAEGACSAETDKIGGSCSDCWEGVMPADNPAYLFNIDPKQASINGGSLNFSDKCFGPKPTSIVLNQWDEVGLHFRRILPAWWNPSGTDLTFRFYNGPSELQSITITGIEGVSSDSYYEGFAYVEPIDWEYFPAPFWPLAINKQLSVATTDNPGGPGNNNALSLLVKNFSSETITMSSMFVDGPAVASGGAGFEVFHPNTGEPIAVPCDDSLGACSSACGACSSTSCFYGLMRAYYGGGDPDNQSNYVLDWSNKCDNTGGELSFPSGEVSGLLMDRGNSWDCIPGTKTEDFDLQFFIQVGSNPPIAPTGNLRGLDCYEQSGYSGEGQFSYIAPLCWPGTC